MKHEILAPAGSYEALLAAVQNGCDAVYLGGQRFGARAYASNFDNEQMVQAIRYCHRYGVKIYVTVNTLIYPEEIEDTLKYIGFLHENHVDAIIVQDYGILHAVRHQYPNLAIHASTQMHIHNAEGVRFLRDLGVRRVVLSRECSIDQIREIHEACPDMELEVFIYGAHCVSYSGQCLMSSMIGNRSGNRGACAQPCRLPYDLIKKNGGKTTALTDSARYLISLKDLNALEHLHELSDAGVTSFKIEGRMKRPEYVAKVVSVCRKAMEDYDKKQPFTLSDADREDLLKLFNRGFTSGHIFYQRGSDIVNPLRPNHIGVEIGGVVYVNAKKKRIGIRLSKPLYQMDGIRFLGKEDDGWVVHKIYRDDLLVNQAATSETIEIDWREGVMKGSKVIKTSDARLLAQLQETFGKPSRKVPVSMKAVVSVGKPMLLTVSDGKHAITKESEIPCDRALKQPLSTQRISEQLGKLNDTPFDLQSIEVINDDASILPISQINQLRRSALEELVYARETANSEDSAPYFKTGWLPSFPKAEMVSEPMLSCSVYTSQQLETARELDIPRIYIHNIDLHDLHPEDQRLIRSGKRVNENHYEPPGSSVLVRELGTLASALAKQQEIYIDDTMNVSNLLAASFFASHKARSIALSKELNETQLNEIAKLLRGVIDIEFTVYGRVENMLLKHCVINSCTVDTKQKDCNMCRIGDQYYLKDRKEEEYPILTDRDCFSHILHHRPLLLLEEVPDILACGVNVLRLDFTIESPQEMKQVIQAFRRRLRGESVTLPIPYTKRFFHQ